MEMQTMNDAEGKEKSSVSHMLAVIDLQSPEEGKNKLYVYEKINNKLFCEDYTIGFYNSWKSSEKGRTVLLVYLWDSRHAETLLALVPKSSSNTSNDINNNIVFLRQFHTIYAFLRYLTTKSTYIRTQHKESLEFLVEDALALCQMLNREGLLDLSVQDKSCAVCAVEILERNIIRQMQKEIELAKLARNYYTRHANGTLHKLCVRHKPYNPIQSTPRYSGFGMQTYLLNLPSVMIPIPTIREVPSPNNSYFLSEKENTVEYFTLEYNWENYLQRVDYYKIDKRMPYTKNFNLKNEKSEDESVNL